MGPGPFLLRAEDSYASGTVCRKVCKWGCRARASVAPCPLTSAYLCDEPRLLWGVKQQAVAQELCQPLQLPQVRRAQGRPAGAVHLCRHRLFLLPLLPRMLLMVLLIVLMLLLLLLLCAEGQQEGPGSLGGVIRHR